MASHLHVLGRLLLVVHVTFVRTQSNRLHHDSLHGLQVRLRDLFAGRTLISLPGPEAYGNGIASTLLQLEQDLEIFSKSSIPLMSQWPNNFSEINTSIRPAGPRPGGAMEYCCQPGEEVN